MPSAPAAAAADRGGVMELGQEIQDAARQLGEALRQDDLMSEYLHAREDAENDPEASSLEKRMHETYRALIARQQAGEGLNQANTSEFCEIRRVAQSHPLISKRNDMLRLIRPYLNQVAEEISLVLGVDYTALAKPQ